MVADITAFFISPENTIQEAMTCIDVNGLGIALIVDEARQLIGTISDGDIRRALLANLDLKSPAVGLLSRKPPQHAVPLTASVDDDRASILLRMKEHFIRQVPLLDKEGRVVDLFSVDEMLQETPLQAVVMAGGFGKRLLPLTETLPKPMLPVGDRPLMELMLEQLRSAGIQRVNITTHYMPEKIKEHFGDGSAFGVKLNYVAEDEPLGTAGGVGLLEPSNEPLLVVNGDLLTHINFRDMFAYHQESKAVLTVAVRKYDFTVPYGVVETENGYVQRLVEKPSFTFFVNAGIYLLNPEAHRRIPRGGRMDMTDLIDLLIAEGQPVASFPIREYWLDIGQHADYEQAQADMKSGNFTK
jgi:dTDP-glucose pyrophosphorylase/CBS domain-containing protein